MKTKFRLLNIETIIIGIVIILNFCFLYSVLWDLIILNSRAAQTVFIIIIDSSCYLYVRSRYNGRMQLTPFSVLMKLYFLMLFVNIFISILNDSNSLFLIISLLIVNFLFYLLLKCFSGNIGLTLKPYIYFSNYIVFASLFILVLLHAHIISLESFQVPNDKFELFYGNLQNNDGSLFFPLNLVFITDSMRNVPFFGDFGIFTGLCHEPHLITLLISPALFVLLFMDVKKHGLYIISYLLFCLMACSVTNLLLLPVCILLYFEVINRNTRFHAAYIIVTIALSLLIIAVYVYLVEYLGLGIIIDKLDSSNASNEISSNIVSYMYQPESLIGSDIFIYSYNENARDIGIINFFLIISNQVILFAAIFRMFLSKDKNAAIIAIALIYFFSHSFKIGQMLYQFPLYMYILYIGHIGWCNINKQLCK